MEYFLPAVANLPVAILGYFLVTCLLANLDRSRLISRGISVSGWWILLLVPGYLIERTRRAGSTAAIPLTWFATFFLSIVASFSFAAAYEIDTLEVEQEIESWAYRQTDYRADVECPDGSWYRVGETFNCTMRFVGTSETGVVTVTVKDDGYYIWEVE